MIQKFFQKTRLKIIRAFTTGKKKPPSAQDKTPQQLTGEKQETGAVKDPAGSRLPKSSDTLAQDARRPVRKKKPPRKRWQPEDFKVEVVPGKVRFHDIDLPTQVLRGIADLKFSYCTPVQAESLPHLFKGKDLVANANTGTGKTAVFLITILSRLQRQKKDRKIKGAQALIIAPTRELVIQIAKDAKKLAKYTSIRIVSVYGGTDYKLQQDLLEKHRCDVVVATPGRLLDFARRKVIDLSSCQTLVIDEADRMLDMGFIPDVRRIVHLVPDRGERQTLMFSATITDEVKRLASQWCLKPVNVAIEPEQVAVDTVEQIVYLVTKSEKYTILYNILKKNEEGRIAVFANQKIEAKKLAERLGRNGVDCVLLTGDVPQKKRMARLESFRSGRVKVLVATDVAGRGIHIEGITHVINYSLPYEPEDYVHRIGRTGRAGAEGISIGFACEEGGFILPEIESFIGKKLDCVVPDENLLTEPPKGNAQKSTKRRYKKPRHPKKVNQQRKQKPAE